MKRLTFKLAVVLSLFVILQIMCSCGMKAQPTAYVYEDLNGDGQISPGEPWFPGVSVSWGGYTQTSNGNGSIFFPMVNYDTGVQCDSGHTVNIHVPEGYEITQNGGFTLDCREPLPGIFDPGGLQYREALFGLHPIALTETPAPTPTASPTATVDPGAPAIQLSVSVDHTACNAANQKFIYKYTITNTGNVPLTGFTLSDDKITSIDCPQKLSSLTLPPGKSATCYGAYFTTPQEAKIGATIHNQASASSAYLGKTVTSSASADVFCKAPPPPVETDVPEATPTPEG
ncbi:MAG: hypothetical protein IT310_03820 [Anaerolineales bacterium]|nr:hypothetical protein [Anaerolineales bacterium]